MSVNPGISARMLLSVVSNRATSHRSSCVSLRVAVGPTVPSAAAASFPLLPTTCRACARR
jgi:hypothetical protein